MIFYALDNTVSQCDKDEILKKLNKKNQKSDNVSETFKEEGKVDYFCSVGLLSNFKYLIKFIIVLN